MRVLHVKIKDPDISSLNYEFLTYIGGQSHIFCSTHDIPLIISADRKMKCNYGKNEHYFLAAKLAFVIDVQTRKI